MKYIDIITSHNISVRYELANTLTRSLAWSIDVSILGFYSILASAITGNNTVLFYILIFMVISFYHLAFEILNNGQSIGKRLMKIKVVTLHGRTAKPQDYFLRWIFRILEITASAGVLAALYVSSTEKNQRIGDLLAQTTVIKLHNEKSYDLETLIKMGSAKRDITYPQVVMYNDSDLMLVKDAMARYKKHSNDANQKFVTTIAKRIANDLNTKLDKRRQFQFLETVLLDYITLTR